MTVQTGTRLGPYEIVGTLGAGGMGEVFRARDTRLGREVAIKVLPSRLAQSPDALDRFEREARAVAALNHPNILALHDIGSQDGVVYAVTELLEGETVRTRLASGPIPVRRALELAIQIARGLATAHDRGIVHRDIKPENLFITRDGRIKILDFGVALQQSVTWDSDGEPTRAMTQPGMLVGTPWYMAPEQIAAEPATPRSDLFAFGLVVYEMIAGSHPFRRDSATATMTAILRDDPPPLAAAGPLPRGVSAIVMRCLEKQPADRPASARDLAFYLESMAGTPTGETATDDTVAVPLSRSARRWPATWWIAAVLTVVATVVGYGILLTERAISDTIDTNLARAERLVRRTQDEQLARLALSARLVASFPELKALFETDRATIRDFLRSYQATNPGAPTLVALAPDGSLLGRTDVVASGAPDARSWSDALLASGGEPSIVGVEGRFYHAAVAASEAGGSLFGYIVAAMLVDQAFAQSLRDATQDEVVLLASTPVASTVIASPPPWESLDDWRERGGRTDRAVDVSIGVTRYAAREVVLLADPPLSAIVAKSRDEAGAPFRDIQRGLVMASLISAGLAIGIVLWLARARPNRNN